MKGLLIGLGLMVVATICTGAAANENNVSVLNSAYKNGVKINVICIGGYKFIVVKDINDNSPNIIQMFVRDGDKSLPAKCDHE